MIPPESLTEEQRAVVAHGTGPAAVRAVAGAGKTTALLHRIRRLVAEGVSPSTLLVTSFNTDTVGDLREGLATLGLDGVHCNTLHALGRRLVEQADLNGLPILTADAPDPGQQAHILARRARTTLANERGIDPDDLGVSSGDLVDQVAAWKQQLAYPNLDAAGLPADARPHASEATHENDDLLALYERFEAHRQEAGWCTYADMLKIGWECLVQSASLRERAQSTHEYVLVDEFQDVSPAQYRILEVLTAPHRNLMVVGDADQSIYSWRGAHPEYLRSFAERYEAAEYRLTDSFRLPLPPLALANGLLEQNEESDKRLHLTTDTEGAVHRIDAASQSAEADTLAEAIQEHLDAGVSPADIAVLVRTYGQTPPLERALLEYHLPHRIDGRPPFYRRPPVQTLLRYLYWAILERRRRSHEGFESPQARAHYTDRFAHILKHPTRYIPHRLVDDIQQTVQKTGRSALPVLLEHTDPLPDDTTERVHTFAETLRSLIQRVDAPADDTLNWLIETIDYEAYLHDRSASAVRGEDRVQTAQALVRFAAAHDSTPALLQHIRRLAVQDNPPPAAVTLRSIHRAKGREWPIVIVPGCNEGTLPLELDDEEPPTKRSRAEERRLFYVACTRTKETLIASWSSETPPSPFLEGVAPRIDAARTVQSALRTPPSTLSDAEAARLCRGVHHLGLERYLQEWWDPSPEQCADLSDRLMALAAQIEAAHEAQSAFEEDQAQMKTEREEAREAARARIDQLRADLGTAPITVPRHEPDRHIPAEARFTFRWTEREDAVEVVQDGAPVGRLDPLGAHRLDAARVLGLPWPDLVGTVAEVNRQRIRFRMDWPASAERAARRAADTVQTPDPPGPPHELLTTPAVRQGCQLLRDALASR